MKETFLRHFEPEFGSCISVHKLKHCKNIVIEGRCHLFSASLFSPAPPMTIIIAMPNRHKMRSENERGVGLVSHFFASEAFYYIFNLFNEKLAQTLFIYLARLVSLTFVLYFYVHHVSKSHVTNKCNLRGFEHMR